MGLLLVAGLVAVVTTAALAEGLHNFLRLQPELEGGDANSNFLRGRGSGKSPPLVPCRDWRGECQREGKSNKALGVLREAGEKESFEAGGEIEDGGC
ncbi:hypothetical protein EYF80_023588 [Liparis tanakae]|uniref:Uncharacterized protein n=1 Tax=Liparis tanakae TaxID=230148 RepID=A0A4Z2HKH9_9TELE|nr:hypothetical protein EYF80_023588 [Liparis tanakae]